MRTQIHEDLPGLEDFFAILDEYFAVWEQPRIPTDNHLAPHHRADGVMTSAPTQRTPHLCIFSVHPGFQTSLPWQIVCRSHSSSEQRALCESYLLPPTTGVHNRTLLLHGDSLGLDCAEIYPY
jgi:hypothetical protein